MLCLPIVTGAARLATQEAITFDQGYPVERGVLSDNEGKVFLEFLTGIYAIYTEGHLQFSGDILPPQILLDSFSRPPRSRMREVVTFELMTDHIDDVTFTDRYALMSYKQRVRTRYLYGESVFRDTPNVKLIVPIERDVNLPALWEYSEGSDPHWKRHGGIHKTTSEDGQALLVASVPGTGLFTVFDENPAPNFLEVIPIAPELVELAPPNPYPSVLPREIEVLDESSSDIPPYINQTEAPEDAENPFSPLEEEGSMTQGEDFIVPALQPITPTTPQSAASESIISPSLEELNIQSDVRIPSVEETQTVLPRPTRSEPQAFNDRYAPQDPNTETLPVAGGDSLLSGRSIFLPMVLMLVLSVMGYGAFLVLRR